MSANPYTLPLVEVTLTPDAGFEEPSPLTEQAPSDGRLSEWWIATADTAIEVNAQKAKICVDMGDMVVYAIDEKHALAQAHHETPIVNQFGIPVLVPDERKDTNG